MRKLSKSQKSMPLTVTITTGLLEHIDEILEKEVGFLSRSDVVRSALMDFYNKKVPKYIYDRSGADQLKRRKLDEIKTFEQMSPVEYAQSLGALVLTSQEGVAWALFHQMGNSIKPFLVEDLKTLANDEGFLGFVRYHKEILKEKSIKDVIYGTGGRYWRQELLKENDILLSDDDDERDNNEDTRLPAPSEDTGVEAERPADSGDEAGPASGIPAREQGGVTGHNGDNAAERSGIANRDQDGEGQTPPSSDSLSEAIGRIRSHSPRSG